MREWIYAFQKKIEKGLKVSSADYRGFDLYQVPPKAEDLSSKILSKLLASTNKLLSQPEWREALRVLCRNSSQGSALVQLARDSLSLAKEAGDDLLLVGSVVKASETHRTYARNFSSKMAVKMNKLVKKLLRLPPYMMEHAMYAAFVPDFQKVASVLRELGSIFRSSPQVFPDFKLFKKAVLRLAEYMQEEFRAGDAYPIGVCCWLCVFLARLEMCVLCLSLESLHAVAVVVRDAFADAGASDESAAKRVAVLLHDGCGRARDGVSAIRDEFLLRPPLAIDFQRRP